MTKLFIGALCALAGAGIAFGQCPLTFEGVEQAQVGVYIASVSGAEVLVDYNSSVLFTPASVMKAVTTAAAINRYGGEYRWCTAVSAVGTLSNGRLRGNILVSGSGDPTLCSEQFKEQPSFFGRLSQSAASCGIQAVEGKVVADSPWPDQGPVPSWELEDIPGVDGAGFYRLNYSDNTFILMYPSMRTIPAVPGLTVKNNGGAGGLRFWRMPGSRELNIYGQLGRKQKRASFKCSMPDPPSALLAGVDSIFRSEGKTLALTTDTLTLLRYYSPTLRDVARSLMVRSDNQMAEATLRLLAPGQSRGAALISERKELSALGVDLKGARLADGSGLSRHNAISPRQLASVLRVMARNSDYINSFARVGLDGTVKSFMSKMPGRDNFILKSGSMTGVVCYVGYRLDPTTKVPSHVVAIMVNNAPTAKQARTAIAKMLSEIKF